MAPDPLQPEQQHSLRRMRVREPDAAQRWTTGWLRLFLGFSLGAQVLRGMLHHAFGWRETPPYWYEPLPASYRLLMTGLIALQVVALSFALARVSRRPGRYVVIFSAVLTVDALLCNYYCGAAPGIYAWAGLAWVTSILEAWRSRSRGRFGSYD